MHNRKSVGIGGHVSTLDSGSSEPYREGMRRELDEEVDIRTEYTESCVGLINDDENEVGKVHLGIVHLLDVQSVDVLPREKDIAEAGFETVSDIMRDLESYETWSKICLQALFG